jgi:hypothetical protein
MPSMLQYMLQTPVPIFNEGNFVSLINEFSNIVIQKALFCKISFKSNTVAVKMGLSFLLAQQHQQHC